MNMTNKFRTAARELLPGEKLILPGTTVGGEVGTFYVDFTLWNRDRTLSRSLNGLVDTGASYTQVPASILDELGIERFESRVFSLADGSQREFSLGWVEMELGRPGRIWRRGRQDAVGHCFRGVWRLPMPRT